MMAVIVILSDNNQNYYLIKHYVFESLVFVIVEVALSFSKLYHLINGNLVDNIISISVII